MQALSESYIPVQVSPVFRKMGTPLDGYLEVCEVLVECNEFELCVESSGNRWSNNKPGTYGRGLINDKNDRHKAERAGILGEMAFGKITGLPVNLAYMEGGDSHDFIVRGKTVNAKTNAAYGNKIGYVTAVYENGKEAMLCDFYVFAYIRHIDWRKKASQVVFVGWEKRSRLKKRVVVPSPISNAQHKNREVPYVELFSIRKMIRFCRSN